jgi:hypothetical protein
MSSALAHNQPAPLALRIHQSRTLARHYLLGRQSPSGGFCFYRSAYLDEPNLFDTWHAVAALNLLGEKLPQQEALVNFVCALPLGSQPYELFYRTFTLDMLNSPDPEHSRVMAMADAVLLPSLTPDHSSELSGQMERLILSLRLKQHFGLAFDKAQVSESVLRMEHPDGGFGNPANLLDTHLALDVLALCGQTATNQTAAFLDRMTVPKFAFRLTQNSLTPTLETVCAGIECCRLFKLPVAYPEDAASVILACQTGKGGFAPASDALPDIGLTHLALHGIAALFDDVPIQSQHY